jgi:hypothetical protein
MNIPGISVLIVDLDNQFGMYREKMHLNGLYTHLGYK